MNRRKGLSAQPDGAEPRLYSTKEVVALTKLDTSRLTQLTAGWTRVWKRKDGTKGEKWYEPKLREGRHYIWKRGTIYYTEAGLQTIQAQQKPKTDT
jgi:hypothetical protein